jgi:hypothetical protein
MSNLLVRSREKTAKVGILGEVTARSLQPRSAAPSGKKEQGSRNPGI